jgi:hypothetical protein
MGHEPRTQETMSTGKLRFHDDREECPLANLWLHQHEADQVALSHISATLPMPHAQ